MYYMPRVAFEARRPQFIACSYSRIVAGWRSPAFYFPFVLFLSFRVLTLAVAFVSVQIAPVQNPFAADPVFQASLGFVQQDGWIHRIIEPLLRWDTGWYINIAGQGYSAGNGTIVFPPMYPALVRAVGWFTGDLPVSGLIVSSVSCLIALVMLYKLVWHDTRNPKLARYTVLALVTFPTAFYLLLAYTESTFLAFVLGTWLAARYKQWWLVAVLVTCATLTRLQGAILFLPMGWLAFVQPRKDRQLSEVTIQGKLKEAFPKVVAVVAAPAAALAYLAFLNLAGLGSIEEAYARVFGWNAAPPWITVLELVSKTLAGNATLIDFGEFFALFAIVFLGLRARKLHLPSYQWYIWFSLVFVMVACDHLYPLNSMTRYSLHFFPIFVAAGATMMMRPRWRLVWVVGGTILQTIMLYLFVHWVWIA